MPLSRAAATPAQITTEAATRATADTDEATARVTADSDHVAASDPHSAAAYAIMVGGGRKIWVQSSDPGGSAANGDIWINTT